MVDGVSEHVANLITGGDAWEKRLDEICAAFRQGGREAAERYAQQLVIQKTLYPRSCLRSLLEDASSPANWWGRSARAVGQAKNGLAVGMGSSDTLVTAVSPRFTSATAAWRGLNCSCISMPFGRTVRVHENGQLTNGLNRGLRLACHAVEVRPALGASYPCKEQLPTRQNTDSRFRLGGRHAPLQTGRPTPNRAGLHDAGNPAPHDQAVHGPSNGEQRRPTMTEAGRVYPGHTRGPPRDLR
jgi:hypothetical protein